MILPVAAMALACDSATETRAETKPAPEPSSEQKEVVQALEASSANTEAAQAENAAASAVTLSSGAPGTTAPSVLPNSGTPNSGTTPASTASTRTSADPKEASAVDAAPRRGLAASGEGFSTWLEGKGSYTLNQAANLELVLTAEEPYKCNEQYPYRFNATPGAGVTFATNPVRSMNVGKQRSTMSIPFTPTAPGNQTVTGELSFSVCTEDKCLIEKQSLSIVVNVQGS
jgi:hypothetical protein